VTRSNPWVVSGRRSLRAAAAGAALVGILFGGLLTGCSAGTVTQGAVPPASASPAAMSAAPLAVPAVTPMSSSVPTRVEVPSIGVESSLRQLGLNPDRTIEVPPLSEAGQAGWFKYRATPGAVGAAVILGHIDGGGQEGVFFRLADTQPGAQITVTRADRSKATFTVSAVREFPKTNFPTDLVYGMTADSELRLISCGGVLDKKAHNYLSNVIVFATLTGAAPA